MARNGIKRRLLADGGRGETAGAAFGAFLARWGLITFVSAWMFVLGVLVGRGTAPIHFDIPRLQEELLNLRRAEETEQLAKLDADSEALFSDAPELEFHEALKETRAEIKLESIVIETPEAKAPSRIENKAPLIKKKAVAPMKDARPPPAGPAPGETERARPPETVKTAEAEKPPQVPPPEAEPAEPAVKVDPGGALAVQVGSFRAAEDARKLVEALKAKKYPAYREAGLVPRKGIWHRVRVGNFTGRDDAEAMMARLKADSYAGILVKRKK